MLGMTKDGGGNSAEYYQSDNYYSADGNPADSEWLGKGATQAGLHGPIDAAMFNQIRAGVMPDGSKPHSENHTPGWDLTASAPKSVSIMALIAGDKRLVTAHREASAFAAKYIETHAGTRVRESDGVHHRSTGNLLIGRFTHDTSRAQDPALHDHLYIMNRTWDAASQSWKAVDSRALYAAKEAAGRLYSAKLAEGVKKAGYEITPQDKLGNFEIKGVAPELNEQFSKRRDAIKQMEAQTERPSTRQSREQIALMTRQNKTTHLSISEKTASWREEAGARTQELDQLKRETWSKSALQAVKTAVAGVTPTRARTAETILDPRAKDRELRVGGRAGAVDAVQHALSHITENYAVFHESDLVSAALTTSAASRTTADQILQTVADIKKAGELIPAQKFAPGDFTTRKIIEAERQIVTMVTDKTPSWRVGETLNVRQAATESILSEDQKKGFHVALSGTQRYAAIVGYAGTGKSFLVRNIKETLDTKAPETKMMTLAPMHKQVEGFRNELGIQSNTIAAFVTENRRYLSNEAKDVPDLSNTIIMVDEAGMNSNEQARDLIQIANKLNVGRVVFMGDPEQKSSPAQGAPFAAMLKAGIERATLKEIRRQKDPTLRKGAYLAATGRIGKALETIDKHVHSSPDKPIEQAAFDHWRALPAAKREEALIIATTRARRNELNRLVREAKIKDTRLTPSERLGATAHDHKILVSKQLSVTQRNKGEGLSQGDQLVFHRNLRGIAVKSGDQLTVVSADPKKQRAQLMKSDGSIVNYKLPGAEARGSHYEAYEAKKFEIRERERLMWTKSNKQTVIQASTLVTVTKIDDKSVTLKDDQGKEQTFDRTDPQLQHMNYGYSQTSFASQGMTKPTVIAVTGVNDRLSGDKAHSYVAMSRVGADDARNEHLAIFTTNRDRLMQRYMMDLSKPDSGLLATKDPLTEPNKSGKGLAPTPSEMAKFDKPSMAKLPDAAQKPDSPNMDFGRADKAR